MKVESLEEMNMDSEDELNFHSEEEMNMDSGEELLFDSKEEMNSGVEEMLEFDSNEEFELESIEELKVESLEELKAETKKKLEEMVIEDVDSIRMTGKVVEIKDSKFFDKSLLKIVALFVLMIGFISLFLGVVFSIFSNYSGDNIKDDENNKLISVDNSNGFSSDSDSSVVFDGTSNYDVYYDIRGKFNIDIPNEFKEVLEGSNSVDYYYGEKYYDFSNNCSFSLKKILGYSSAEGLAKAMANYYRVDDIQIKDINGIKWYYFNYGSVTNIDIYITELYSDVFIFEYDVGNNCDKNVCNKYRNSIINSVSYK